jgi:hypothetical protein
VFMKGLHFSPMEEHLRRKKIFVNLCIIFYLFTYANFKLECYSAEI